MGYAQERAAGTDRVESALGRHLRRWKVQDSIPKSLEPVLMASDPF